MDNLNEQRNKKYIRNALKHWTYNIMINDVQVLL